MVQVKTTYYYTNRDVDSAVLTMTYWTLTQARHKVHYNTMKLICTSAVSIVVTYYSHGKESTVIL